MTPKKSILDEVETSREQQALPILQPTHAHIHDRGREVPWNSREHRKGRHARPASGRQPKIVWINWNPGNISWIVGMLFTVGSVVWCINGFFVFLPLVHPRMAANEDAIAWTAWVGGTIFIFGAYSAFLESLNRGHKIDLGQAVWSMTFSEKDPEAGLPSPAHVHSRHIPIHQRKQHLFHHPAHDTDTTQAHWSWFGARWQELGFIGTSIQMMAASIFWIACVTALPGALAVLTGAVANGVYWLPQVVGGAGFIISSLIFMLETQPRWWQIQPLKLGWQVALWNLIGGIGFCLCGALGFSSSSGAVYQSGLSTFWGSWAFLIGSYMQWWEGMNSTLVKLKGFE